MSEPPANSVPIPARPAAVAPGPTTVTARNLVPWVVAVAFFMESLDATILNTAVPTIASALQVAPLSMKAALTSYTISLAVFIPISGWVADRFGTRAVFSTAISIFTVGSLLCGMSVSMPMLVASRILQGCGGAMMMPVGRITMVRTFPKSELIRAMAFVAIPGLIGPLLGPLVGGFIVGFFHWRVIFFVNLPIGMIGFYLVYRILPNYKGKAFVPLDFIGFVLFGSGIALLSYVLEVFGEHRMGSTSIVGMLSISALLLIGYGFNARKERYPLLRLDMFRIRTFQTSIVGGFITRLGAGGMPFLLPLYYQIGLGFTPLQAGLLISPQPLAAMSLKMIMPKILTKFGYRRVLLVNTAVMGGMMALFATITPATPVAVIVVQAFIFGFASSLQYTSMNSLVFADVNDTDTSAASTILSTSQQMSMSFGIACASFATAIFLGGVKQGSPPEMIHAIRGAFIVLGVLTIISTIVFRQLREGDGGNVSRHKADDPAKAQVQE